MAAFGAWRPFAETFLVAPQTEAAKHAHESGPLITIPLVILAALSTLTGWAVLKYEAFSEYLAPSVTTEGYAPTLLQPYHLPQHNMLRPASSPHRYRFQYRT